jgi:hypothetical protein
MLYQKIEYCCRLLGVSTQANLAIIKKAYWQKSKQYHPDINPSADAHNTFIALTEAYDFLHDMLSSNASLESYRQQYTRVNETTTTASSTTNTYNNEHEAQKMADARARYYAFIHSDEYKMEIAFQNVGQFVKCLVLGIILTACIIFNITLLIGGEAGAWLSALGALFFGILFNWNYRVLTLNTLRNDVKMIFRDRQVSWIIIGFLGIVIQVTFMATIWMCTLIAFWIPLLGVVMFVIAAYVISSFFKRTYSISKKMVYVLLIAPNIINLFLVLNYAFAHSPYKYGYYISYGTNLPTVNVNGAYMMPWDVFFTKYDDYPSVTANKRDKIPYGHTYAVYTFKEGLFGIDIIDRIDYL